MSTNTEKINLRNSIREFLDLIVSEKKAIGYVYFLTFLTSLVGILLPLGFQFLTNLISGGMWFSTLITGIFLVIGVVLFNGIIVITQFNVLEKIQQRLFARISYELTLRLPKMKTSSTGVNPDYKNANHFIEIVLLQKSLPKILIDFPSAILQLILGLILLCFYHIFFVLPVILLIILSYFVITNNIKKGLSIGYIKSKYKYKVFHHFQTIYQRLNNYKLYDFDRYILEKTDENVYQYNNYRKKYYKVLQNQYIYFVALKVIVTAMLVVVGAWLVINKDINLGQFVAAEIIILMLINAIEKFITYYDVVYDSLISVHKLNALLKHPVNAEKSSTQKVLNEEIQLLELMLSKKNVPIKIERNKKYIIQTENKKTSINIVKELLLLNEEDHLYINGIPSKDLVIETYKKAIATITRFDAIIEAPLLENIILSHQNISFQSIDEILELSELKEYIKEYGLSHVIIPDAEEIHLLFRFKILVARALYSKPQLLIIDDKYSAFLNNHWIEKLRTISTIVIVNTQTQVNFDSTTFIIYS